MAPYLNWLDGSIDLVLDRSRDIRDRLWRLYVADSDGYRCEISPDHSPDSTWSKSAY